MNGGEKFFVEDAFGRIFEKNFCAEDVRYFAQHSSNSAANAEEAAIDAATSQVRMLTESEVLRESSKAFISACNFGDLLSSNSPQFTGKIFNGI